jgi:hypothetical protein
LRIFQVRFLGFLSLDQIEGSSCRDLRLGGEREREREREEMTRYEVNGCFFCVKYMWENDTWGTIRREGEGESRGGCVYFVDVGEVGN